MASPTQAQEQAELAALDALFVALGQDRAKTYSNTAALVVLVYDTLLNMDHEIEQIWMAAWSVPKVLYILARYYSIVHVSLMVALGIATNLSDAMHGVVLALSARRPGHLYVPRKCHPPSAHPRNIRRQQNRHLGPRVPHDVPIRARADGHDLEHRHHPARAGAVLRPVAGLPRREPGAPDAARVGPLHLRRIRVRGPHGVPLPHRVRRHVGQAREHPGLAALPPVRARRHTRVCPYLCDEPHYDHSHE
ncbi:hypothetical protein PsYK624_088570 [Phanerochaete sordida]|uniref:DUF6533 domain-containing protein n=1 Tax=Phanerochaete sordida TaxID=48140 RepID=A0A9P3GDC4_9APHY|nr:hypothetical protein PsYK624_088570 [Phanerochaete sordida]